MKHTEPVSARPIISLPAKEQLDKFKIRMEIKIKSRIYLPMRMATFPFEFS